jgi:hypothetical protein
MSINVQKIEQIAGSIDNGRVGTVSSSSQISDWAQSALSAVGAACDVSTMIKKTSMPRQTWYGIPTQMVVAGTSFSQTLTMNQIFVGQELRVSESISADVFAISKLMIKTSEQFVNYPVYCHIFSELSLNASIDMDPAQTGTPIQLTVTNINSAGQTNFIGSFYGYTVTGC